MATDLGIGRHWFHAGDKPHYDVPVRDRERIGDRAASVSPRAILDIIKGGRPMPTGNDLRAYAFLTGDESPAEHERLIEACGDCVARVWQASRFNAEMNDEPAMLERVIHDGMHTDWLVYASDEEKEELLKLCMESPR